MGMNIGWAIAHMNSTIGAGRPCRRTAWPDAWRIAVQKPGGNSRMTQPFIYLDEGGGVLAPWSPTMADLLAEDYEWAI